jgi:hypothetical protein
MQRKMSSLNSGTPSYSPQKVNINTWVTTFHFKDRCKNTQHTRSGLSRVASTTCNYVLQKLAHKGHSTLEAAPDCRMSKDFQGCPRRISHLSGHAPLPFLQRCGGVLQAHGEVGAAAADRVCPVAPAVTAGAAAAGEHRVGPEELLRAEVAEDLPTAAVAAMVKGRLGGSLSLEWLGWWLMMRATKAYQMRSRNSRSSRHLTETCRACGDLR